MHLSMFFAGGGGGGGRSVGLPQGIRQFRKIGV